MNRNQRTWKCSRLLSWIPAWESVKVMKHSCQTRQRECMTAVCSKEDVQWKPVLWPSLLCRWGIARLQGCVLQSKSFQMLQAATAATKFCHFLMAEVVDAIAGILSLFNQGEKPKSVVWLYNRRYRLSGWHETCSYFGMEANPSNRCFSTKVRSD